MSVEVRRTSWVRAGRSGLVHLRVGLRSHVTKGQEVAVMHDTFGTEISKLHAPLDGIVIGHSTNPLLNRGEAVLHIASIPGLGG